MKLGILFFGRKRPGFDPGWGREVEGDVKAWLAGTAYDALVHDPYVVDETTLDEAAEALRSAGVDVPVIIQPTMSDGRLALRFGQKWHGALVLWATPERVGATKVSACSLVGTHVFAANLRQHQRPFELVYGTPGEADTNEDFDQAVRAVYASGRLRRAKVGLLGYHAPGFVDMHADPFDLSLHLGAQLWHTDLQELFDRMDAVSPAALEQDGATMAALGLPMDEVAAADLVPSSRFYLAIKALFEEEDLDALAVREWPELSKRMDHWPYLAIARLLGDGLPIACEGDVDGAITSLLGCKLGLGPGHLTDWLAHDRETITLWHGGCAPIDLCDPIGSETGPRVARHFNSRTPAVVNAVLSADRPLTLCRIWRCDGEYHLMAQEVTTLEPKQRLAGTVGLVQVEGRNVREWFRELCFAGMPHHVIAFPGKRAALLLRFAQFSGIGVF